jgi:RNA polymerase sigma-70 factor, ECF subfamily
MTPPRHDERALLAAARGGDEDAFLRLIGPYRGELEAHCRRTLAPFADEAEDVMQEVLLRAWRALAGFQERASLRSWLYRIATNACLNAIEKRRRTVLPLDYGPADGDCPAHDPWDEPRAAGEPALGLEDDAPAGIEGIAERRERVEAAVRTAVEELPANQRAALILRDVVGLSARESAATLATTPASVNSALQRARATLDRGPSAGANPRPAAVRRNAGELVAGLVAAFARDDVATVVAIAADTSPPGDRAWTFSPVPAY